jgi:hypothetical protein
MQNVSAIGFAREFLIAGRSGGAPQFVFATGPDPIKIVTLPSTAKA